MDPLSYVGPLAAFCTTTAFIPQIVKIKKQGADDLSYPMLFLYLTGVVLWLVYGLLLHAAAIIWANSITSFLWPWRSHSKPHPLPPRAIAKADDRASIQCVNRHSAWFCKDNTFHGAKLNSLARSFEWTTLSLPRGPKTFFSKARTSPFF